MIEQCMGCKGMFEKIAGPTHAYIESVPGCWHVYTQVLAKEYADYASLGNVHRVTVDTCAVQHPGQPTRKAMQSVAGHLVALYFFLEQNLDGDATRQKLKIFVEAKKDLPWLEPPNFDETLHVSVVVRAETVERHKKAVAEWARSVWQAWNSFHRDEILRLTSDL